MTMTYPDWMDAAAEEYRRLNDLLDRLSPEDWSLPTDCVGWEVKDVVAHLVGAAEFTASARERVHQLSSGFRRRSSGQQLIDAMNDVQVSERVGWTAGRVQAALVESGARSVTARRRTPTLVRAVRLPFGRPLGIRPLGYLLGRIYTRDAWMHRIDLARATEQPLYLTPDQDGRIVDDVVTEWADQHGQAFTLQLDGPAGGHWERGSTNEGLALDAIEFCRILSGRERGVGLLSQGVAF